MLHVSAEARQQTTNRTARRVGVAGAVVGIAAGLGWLVAAWSPSVNAQSTDMQAGTVLAIFEGTTPAGEVPTQRLGLAHRRGLESLRWRVALYDNSHNGAADRYEIQVVPTTARGRATGAVMLRGRWRRSPSGQSGAATVYELSESLRFVTVGPDLLQFLNPDGTMMVGDGGWSYTLSRVGRHTPGDSLHSRSSSAPDVSYPIGPLAVGPGVFGVFEGRTPCEGVARALELEIRTGCFKVKWRVTLYRDPTTHAPTTYVVEGSLFPRGAREGLWTVVPGAPGIAPAIVFRLEPRHRGAPILLGSGDPHVLFLSHHDLTPMVGNADFAYTLNRRHVSAPR